MRKLVLPLAVVAVALLAGTLARGQIDAEITPSALQEWVAGLGWKGPFIFTALVTFRQFLLLPSAILLPAGGLCFGVLAGTALGAAGILLSGVVKFSIARSLLRDWIRQRLGERGRRIEQRIDRTGPFVVGLVTAHPIGPMTWIHWVSGVTSLSLTSFAVAVALGGTTRAASFSYFGAMLVDPGSPHFFVALGVLLGVMVAPLAHPGLRRAILVSPGAATIEAEADPALPRDSAR